jgi:predicted acetyltransferase
MKFSIRPLQGDGIFDVLYPLAQYALHPTPPFQNREEWLNNVRGRKGLTSYASFEDEKPVSIAVSTAMTQNLRGKLFPASGVWGVATDPSARRKGYCRQTITSLLAAEKESGKVFSNLYPFRESFYERMGYVSFPLTKVAKLSTLSLSPLLNLNTGGEIELKPVGEVFGTYREYLADVRQHRHGMGFFDFGDQSAADRANLWLAFARFDGQVEGLILYRIQGEEVTKFNFVAYRFYYRSSRARTLMLSWIAHHIDQTDRVELSLPPDEYPETWLSDIEVKVESAVRSAMNRVLDVEKIGGMNAGDGAFSVEVIDPICPWNESMWHFEESDGKLEVSKSSKADCELTIQALSALIAGTRDPQDFPLRGWGNPDSKIQAVMREMFPRTIPFLHENF